MQEAWKTIDIEMLNFSHNEEKHHSKVTQGLKDVDIHIARGKKIALIGESGSGKSTLLALLRGLYGANPSTAVYIDSKEEILEVCQLAHFEEVVRQLPKGLQSNIQEKGVNLSGGQKQRLALVRGILAARESNIVLLDEPTSSVDPKTEMIIFDKLFEAFKEKVIVASLHRLHLLTKFDYIYLLENGQVLDEGTFEELRMNSPVFQELWRHQEEAH